MCSYLKQCQHEKQGETTRQSVERCTRGTFRAIQVTTPPTESPFIRTLSMASIIFSATTGSGHLTMLASIYSPKSSNPPKVNSQFKMIYITVIIPACQWELYLLHGHFIEIYSSIRKLYIMDSWHKGKNLKNKSIFNTTQENKWYQHKYLKIELTSVPAFVCNIFFATAPAATLPIVSLAEDLPPPYCSNNRCIRSTLTISYMVKLWSL